MNIVDLLIDVNLRAFRPEALIGESAKVFEFVLASMERHIKFQIVLVFLFNFLNVELHAFRELREQLFSLPTKGKQSCCGVSILQLDCQV